MKGSNLTTKRTDKLNADELTWNSPTGTISPEETSSTGRRSTQRSPREPNTRSFPETSAGMKGRNSDSKKTLHWMKGRNSDSEKIDSVCVSMLCCKSMFMLE